MRRYSRPIVVATTTLSNLICFCGWMSDVPHAFLYLESLGYDRGRLLFWLVVAPAVWFVSAGVFANLMFDRSEDADFENASPFVLLNGVIVYVVWSASFGVPMIVACEKYLGRDFRRWVKTIS